MKCKCNEPDPSQTKKVSSEIREFTEKVISDLNGFSIHEQNEIISEIKFYLIETRKQDMEVKGKQMEELRKSIEILQQ